MNPDRILNDISRRHARTAPSGWILSVVLILAALQLDAAELVRKPMEPGVHIAIKNGRTLYIECQPPRGPSKSTFLKKYLADESSWKRYEKLRVAPIQYRELKPAVQRRVIETIFPNDFADEKGWWHSVTFEGAAGVESWWNLSEWLTGRGTNYRALEALPQNQQYMGTPRKGQVLFIPRDLLKDVFKTPTPGRNKAVVLEPMPAGEEFKTAFVEQFYPGELRYGNDAKGPYAAYRMKKGEAIYTSVVIRFTDFQEVVAVQEAAAEILGRNGIADPTRIHVDQEIRVPLDMLSDRYQPEGSAQRLAFESASQDARRLRTAHSGAKDLDGVVIILDPGHGGCDQGAAEGDLLEDELNYDLALRMKHVLETTTRARVYMTFMDLSQKDKVSDKRGFVHDTDEVVLTTPPYNPENTSVSANLRWYVANDIYRAELKRGVKPENMIFASIHCDKLYYKLRGSMVYIPGAAHRLSDKALDGPSYAAYTKGGNRFVSTTAAEHRRDEAMSRNFAETLLKSLRTHNPPIAVHSTSDPIRNVIQRSRTERWLPAVLKHTLVPTKVLVETANLQNPDDQKRLADPQWRQWYAEAFVNAVREHFTA